MRAPFQVLVFPYRRTEHGDEVLICRRADINVWQGVSGGGEDHESPSQAAIRELKEETGLSGKHWQQLDAMCMLPRVMFKDHQTWQTHPFVIPEYALMVEVTSDPVLSHEHSEYQWCNEAQATALLKFDSNRIAVWEIFQRLNV
ncbi:NUDIX hydrolase [Vibrio quintilis]|uniref:Dihydroneopterin triphosphate pyrophosphatase n=1 Tax=Vibrio quintilis TaxID=1117707 RepID=A0A1M7YW87_9VIBR|nr:NUDIX pyrophosphatase [Vibrio quintilis]SHO56881.1 dihydroneopterin triphosphate pyrophosphatase [Vibrio quintilis]